MEEIKQQLAYRSDNKEKVARFKVTRSFGEYWRVLIDDTHRWFAVTHDRSLSEANPDILSFDDLTECRLDIDESSKELKRKNKNGDMGSYNPPRYEYSYDFDITLTVNNPYFDEMKFQLNPGSVEVVTESTKSFAGGLMGQLLNTGLNGFDPSYNPDYRKYRQMADELVAAMNAISWVPALMRCLGSPKISQRHSLPHGIARPAVRQTAVSSANIAERRTLTH